MTIAFRSATSSTVHRTGVAGGTHVVTVPAGVTNGDLMLMAFNVYNTTGTVNLTLAGWGLILNGPGQLTVARIASSEPASYTVTVASSQTIFDSVAVMTCYSGVPQDANGAHVYCSSASGAAGTATGPVPAPTFNGTTSGASVGGLGPCGPNDMATMVYMGLTTLANSTNTFTPTSGFTNRASISSAGANGSGNVCIMFQDKLGSPVLTGATSTISQNNGWINGYTVIAGIPYQSGFMDHFE